VCLDMCKGVVTCGWRWGAGLRARMMFTDAYVSLDWATFRGEGVRWRSVSWRGGQGHAVLYALGHDSG
jgi:hypothetical protein